MMSWLDIVDQRLMWPGTAYGRARAAWRRVLGLLDSFLMSFSTRLRLAGSTLELVAPTRLDCWRPTANLIVIKRRGTRKAERPRQRTRGEEEEAVRQEPLASHSYRTRLAPKEVFATCTS